MQAIAAVANNNPLLVNNSNYFEISFMYNGDLTECIICNITNKKLFETISEEIRSNVNVL